MAIKGLDKLDKIEATLGRDIEEAIGSSIEFIANSLVDLLQKNAPDDTTDLQRSIGPVLPIKKTDKGYVLQITWEEYGTYQDAGVAGTESGQSLGQELGYGKNFKYTDKMPPASVFEKWAKANSASAFLAARSVFRKGLKATKWASNTIESQEAQKLIDQLADLIVKQYNKS